MIFGVFSARNSIGLRQKYLLTLGIQCGFIYLRSGFANMLSTILSVLEVVEARGRRKYIRVSCGESNNCRLNIKQENESFITGKILDVSIVGFSCTLDQKPKWAKNLVINDMQLSFVGMSFITKAVFFASRTSETGELIYVFLFLKDDILEQE